MKILKPTLLLISCDSYRPIAHVTIKKLNSYGVTNYFDCYVSQNEFAEFDIDGFKVIRSDINTGWSAELYSILEKINNNYVFIWLDDFVPITRPPFKYIVDTINVAIGLDLNYLRFIPTPVPSGNYNAKIGMYEIDPNQIYRTSIRFCLWKVDLLKSLLDIRENAWEFEYNSPQRAMLYKNFYSTKNFIFNHVNLVVKGKVDPRAESILTKHGVNLSKLEWERLGLLEMFSLRFVEIRSMIFNLLPVSAQSTIKKLF